MKGFRNVFSAESNPVGFLRVNPPAVDSLGLETFQWLGTQGSSTSLPRWSRYNPLLPEPPRGRDQPLHVERAIPPLARSAKCKWDVSLWLAFWKRIL